jgi:SAM-dependent methyltransferase
MGLNYYLAREILAARADSGIDQVATIGQLQHYVLPKQAARLQADFGIGDAWARRPFGAYGPEFFDAAGTGRLSVFDASDYEGADVVHDLNEPVPASLHEQYDQVIDGGSLEHIFRPDQALANLMRMVRVGGSLLIWTPANNLCGHGFYQFSPEFFFSALEPARGFALATALLVECEFPSVSLVAPRAAYRVSSPREVRARVGVVSRRPLMMLVRAVKTEHLDEPLAVTPQQSDYAAEWDAGEATSRVRALGRLSATVRDSALTGPLVRRALGVRERRRFSLGNRAFFAPER